MLWVAPLRRVQFVIGDNAWECGHDPISKAIRNKTSQDLVKTESTPELVTSEQIKRITSICRQKFGVAQMYSTFRMNGSQSYKHHMNKTTLHCFPLMRHFVIWRAETSCTHLINICSRNWGTCCNRRNQFTVLSPGATAFCFAMQIRLGRAISRKRIQTARENQQIKSSKTISINVSEN